MEIMQNVSENNLNRDSRNLTGSFLLKKTITFQVKNE